MPDAASSRAFARNRNAIGAIRNCCEMISLIGRGVIAAPSEPVTYWQQRLHYWRHVAIVSGRLAYSQHRNPSTPIE